MRLKDILNHYDETEHEPTVQVWQHRDYGYIMARIRMMAGRNPDVVFDCYNPQHLRVEKDEPHLAAALKVLGVQGSTFDLDWD